ncbi:J domain-containing protein [Cyanobium sp. ATX 6A2]|uniref:J domain-containing protein n=1 Tax=Cyanobium sp. ATX 6A2 TaxID=2823700 RepID=UPI0020CD7AF7|nr:J domain-containing protein [Cyanobium sp. ATX 6A2]
METPSEAPPAEAPPAEAPSSTGSLRRADTGGDKTPRREPAVKGFAAPGGNRDSAGRRRKRRSKGLSRADWGALGKHPDLKAILARQRLHLPLSGRLTADQVNRAWKDAAAEYHPDRGGAHDTMQAINAARDLLLGRGEG